MRKENFFSARRVAGMGILLALVIVLQVFGGYIKIGTTPLSFVLVPIVLGAILFGPTVGGFLGFAFGLIVLLYGVFGLDGFTMVLFNDHPIWTSILCLGKGTAAGVIAGLVYKIVAKKNGYAATFVAAATAPLVNTGLFILGALLMSDTLSANFVADGTTVIYFLVIVCAGINFLIELAINLICSPAIYTVLRVASKGKIK
ncbi:MAG: ECF transporter S component [Clostridia bacterium]|nr:ECF transporter S component [Clostridia bacterium]